MIILITGATGFVGSHLVEAALAEGMDVWAAVRPSSNLQYLQDKRIHLVSLDLSDESQLTAALRPLHLDYVVHAAAMTKALRREQFYEVNTEGTKHLVRALEATQPSLKRLVFISSLSLFGPVREEQPYTDILPTDTPQPNTDYGRSKLAAERWLQAEARLPYTILRPTGVYGPREKDYMTMVDSIRGGLDTAVGFQRQDITFVYVLDVVQAVFKSMRSKAAVGKAYFLSDGSVYTSRDFSDLIRAALGKRFILRLTVPVWVLRLVCAVSDFWMHRTGKLSTLNNDHFNILRQRNWRCDISDARRDFGYAPEWQLERGVKAMLHNG